MKFISTTFDEKEYKCKDKIVMIDTFRQDYKELDGLTKDTIFVFKKIAENLEKEFDLAQSEESLLTVDKRRMALARTNLEQAIMWAVKAIT